MEVRTTDKTPDVIFKEFCLRYRINLKGKNKYGEYERAKSLYKISDKNDNINSISYSDFCARITKSLKF